jgi:predicted O-linked N-acetylglucosamine transferase (SPINDLY family)
VNAAAAVYAEAVQRAPDDIDALLGYARVLDALGRGTDALETAERALTLNPDAAAAHLIRGAALRRLKRLDEATGELRAALRLQPNYVEAYDQLASTCNLDDRPDEAIECCTSGLELDSTSASLHSSMATALHAQGRGAEAIEYFRKVLVLFPDDSAAHSRLLYSLNFVDGYAPADLFQEHLEWARRNAEPLTEIAAPYDNDATPDRKLKVGYVSPHFYQHAVNLFVEPILLAHDHRNFEIFCYASVARPDAVTARLGASVDHWRDVSAKTDERLAALVRADKIDILVDLCGHMGRPRLLAFARRPAPIQVTYIGYQNTTGMSAMDYRLTDLRADPPGRTDAYYTECLVRLPRSFFCYQPTESPDVSPLPALESGRVTFGSLNNQMKVTPRVIDTWLEVLKRVADSRLLVLACPEGYARRRFRELAEQKGIDASRIEFRARCSRGEYLRLAQQMDIALDPFPFNGHTTTCDAIWMGVPVVMLEGETYASRFGGCVLAPVGLEHLIARSADQYVDLAAGLAGDLRGLAQLRGQLRSRMARSALLDFAGFTRNLEEAYRRMWIDWCGNGVGEA